jgi:hypothetical protein
MSIPTSQQNIEVAMLGVPYGYRHPRQDMGHMSEAKCGAGRSSNASGGLNGIQANEIVLKRL